MKAALPGAPASYRKKMTHAFPAGLNKPCRKKHAIAPARNSASLEDCRAALVTRTNVTTHSRLHR